MSRTTPQIPPPAAPLALLWPLIPAVALVVWAFFPTFEFMYGKWVSDPQYSHGFLVPLFSAYVLWRGGLARLIGGGPWPIVGCTILVAALGLRWLAGGLLFYQLDALALMMSLIAVTLAVGGVRMLKGAAPALLFLVFMVPLPYEIEQNVGAPLKLVATTASTYLLQTIGHPAIAEGNVILIDDVTLGVVDACSGLKMLMTFAAFAVGAVILLDRTRFEKLMILLGIVPIAIVTNVLRITATGVAYTMTQEKATLHFLHDLHGWLMMPLGLALLGLQLWALGRLVVRPAPVNPLGGFAPFRPAFA
ncbi:exosortase/archaeosortase family protein [Fimbriiglobus ruber]|uniref:Eight transmembrane protein EpsH n=1 Tax=Fimbriiglobus ruber TaxID=1908690 RepID=A0A225DQA7_9BACT|nr:exosortase/archaeosortase family protein [Fimbriiglobus ruber]OWK43572.1 Eight transmembrane protein EpsH [Fimbriiglobus ruber]